MTGGMTVSNGPYASSTKPAGAMVTSLVTTVGHVALAGVDLPVVNKSI